MLESFETCFEKLAECQHMLHLNGVTEETLGWFGFCLHVWPRILQLIQAAKDLARAPQLGVSIPDKVNTPGV